MYVFLRLSWWATVCYIYIIQVYNNGSDQSTLILQNLYKAYCSYQECIWPYYKYVILIHAYTYNPWQTFLIYTFTELTYYKIAKFLTHGYIYIKMLNFIE